MPSIRDYRHTADHPHVVNICRDVYGGTDALPAMILSQSRDPDTRVFASVDGDDVIHAVVCCQRRAGGAVFVWGLRTRPERRGQGLARQLMERVEAHARETPGVQALQSTTISANATMVRLFSQLGYASQAQLDIWHSPSDGAGAAAGPAPPGGGGRHRWRPAATLQELRQALVHLRRRRRRLDSEHHEAAAASLPGGAAHAAFCWLPGEYVLHPWGSAHTRALLQAGRIWLLDAPPPAGPSPPAGVLLLDAGHSGVTFAGVVVESAAGLAAAVAQAAALAPACRTFYVDRCEGFRAQEGTYEGGELRDYVAVHKLVAP